MRCPRTKRLRVWIMLGFLAAAAAWCCGWAQETRSAEWRTASDAELRSVIPARAPVVQERIETEMRSASGITNGHGKYIAALVLVAAGDSAGGNRSLYFVTQVPLRIGTDTQLAAGE